MLGRVPLRSLRAWPAVAALALAAACGQGRIGNNPTWDAPWDGWAGALDGPGPVEPDAPVGPIADAPPPCEPGTFTFPAVADAYVNAGQPGTNYGAAMQLLTDLAPDEHVYVRFDVGPLVGPIASARLRLFVTNSSTDGPDVFVTGNDWTENDLTWANKPAAQGAALADFGSRDVGWAEVELGPGAAAPGPVSYVLVPTSSNGLDISSRESSDGPELVVRVECPGSPPDAGRPDAPPAGMCGDGVCGRTESCGGCPADCGMCPEGSWSFLVISDTRSNMTAWGTAVASMATVDSGAVGLFDVGDITLEGTEAQWIAHKDAMAAAAPDPVGVFPSLFRADLTTWHTAYVRFIGVLGNHDVGSTGWRTRWEQFLPGQVGLGAEPGQVFTLTHSNAIFFVLDSDHGDMAVSEQTAWLEAQLASPEAQAATWKFAFFHRPVYVCRGDKSPFSGGLAWVSLFEQHGVDVVFVGDSHTFERTCPMVGGGCQPGGVVYMNTASAGAGPHGADLTLDRTVSSGGRTDAFSCGEILAPANGGLSYEASDRYFFCHVVIQGRRLDMDCYEHDDPTAPYGPVLTITK